MGHPVSDTNQEGTWFSSNGDGEVIQERFLLQPCDPQQAYEASGSTAGSFWLLLFPIALLLTALHKGQGPL